MTPDPKGRDGWIIKGSDETWLVRRHGQARSTLYQPLAKSSPVPIEAYTGDRLVVMWWVGDPKTEETIPDYVVSDAYIPYGTRVRMASKHRFVGVWLLQGQ